jgi:hypothetical protein
VVVSDLLRTPAARAPGHVRKWPGHRITYTESIPAKWDWSLDQALQAWNGSGGHLKFVKSKGQHAQLTIGYGDTQGAAGYATIGPARHAFVHLSPAYKRVDTTAEQKVWVGRLLTHELGHVVGFEHTGGKCSLMVAIFDFNDCPLLDKEPGYYICRWIDQPLLKRFVAAYGGKAKLANGTCLIDPLPGLLGNARFSGGGTTPVRFTWSAPTSAPPGSTIHVEAWPGSSCAGNPAREIDVSLPLGVGVWTDPSDGTGGSHCFRAQVVNQYGAGPPAVTAVLSRYQTPVAPPTVGGGTWDPAAHGWTFTATWPANTSLVAYSDFGDPGTCPAPGAAGADVFEQGDSLFLDALGTSQCVTFVARSSAGVSSTPVTRTFQEPQPPAPQIVHGPDYDAGADAWSVTVAEEEGYFPVAEVRPGACPGTVPTDLTWPDSPDFFQAPAPGDYCYFLALSDVQFDWYGPVEMRTFTQP